MAISDCDLRVPCDEWKCPWLKASHLEVTPYPSSEKKNVMPSRIHSRLFFDFIRSKVFIRLFSAVKAVFK